MNRPYHNPKWHELKKHLANDLGLRKKLVGIAAGERMWNFFYHRTIKHLGGITHHLVPQTELAEMAHPFYNQFARGGEGHLEVGKNVYYTVHRLCHMVLALKPFGCMPSSQSDGVQSAVVNKFKDMIFLPIETSGEGEVNAHSRVQMALGEAKVKAKAEFEQVLQSTGKSLEEIREYVEEHPELKRPFYKVPHREGIAGTAAQFVSARQRPHRQPHALLEALTSHGNCGSRNRQRRLNAKNRERVHHRNASTGTTRQE